MRAGSRRRGQALFPVQQGRIIIRMGRQLRCRGIEHPPLPFQAQPNPVRPGFHRPDLRVGRTQAQQIDTVLGGQPGELAATFAGSRLRRTAPAAAATATTAARPAGGIRARVPFIMHLPAGPAASCARGRPLPYIAAMQAWKFYFITFGCKVNQYETQSLREAWQARGGVECDDPAQAAWSSSTVAPSRPEGSAMPAMPCSVCAVRPPLPA